MGARLKKLLSRLSVILAACPSTSSSACEHDPITSVSLLFVFLVVCGGDKNRPGSFAVENAAMHTLLRSMSGDTPCFEHCAPRAKNAQVAPPTLHTAFAT